MTTQRQRRSYQQHCGLARALDVLGERWTLLMVRDLLLGPRRFVDLLEGLPGLTTNLLSARLRHLENEGILTRQPLDLPASGMVYALTEKGRSLEPVVMELGRWGQRYNLGPKVRRGHRIDPRWGLLAMKRRYLGGADMTITLIIRPDRRGAIERKFQMRMSPVYVDVREGMPFDAKLEVSGTFDAWKSLFYGGARARDLEMQGSLVVSGPAEEWDRFLVAFDLSADP